MTRLVSAPERRVPRRFRRVEPPTGALEGPNSDLVEDTSDVVTADRTRDDLCRGHLSFDRGAQYPGRRRSWAMART